MGVIYQNRRFSLDAPLVCSIWMSHDLQTWWHREEGAYGYRHMQWERRKICPFKSELQQQNYRFTHSTAAEKPITLNTTKDEQKITLD